MRVLALCYFVFSFSLAVNAFDLGAWFDTAIKDIGNAFKNAGFEIAKFSEGVGSEVSNAAQTVGAFIDEQVQIIVKEAGFEDLEAIKGDMARVVNMADEFKRHLDEHDISIEDFSQRLSDALAPHYEALSEEVDGEGLTSREEKIALALDHTGQALLFVSDTYDLPQDKTRSLWDELATELLRLLEIIGQVIIDHPLVIFSILFYITFLGAAVPLFLRLLLSFFGFGVRGPIAGSAAAWAQRYFWGAAVESGSWFAWMQRAGMAAAKAG
ncbi:hypothetical protein CYLTODRAFT_421805 [Cylindrobasidium torrendii FP15055 ss-10]|uniref:Uncharacterized protein n=1 Tax=Cylindrobasidium torrendii FP15055 ss-10 TaxID=1314674 RepID=A0A0D7BDI7_9AGAR|nr:hypothetical protein CYLTODRAFT_421805 [Cylindrobasidium torrendii FP15055 ss-10]